MAQEFIASGRIVAGHPSKLRPKKDARTRQPVIKDGQPVQQIYFALAVPKAAFDTQPTANGLTIRQILEAEARVAFPNGVPPNFSWKFKDGDGIDSKGQPYSKREGYAGHYVINYTIEGFAPAIYKHEGGSYRQLNPEEIKCGDFAAVKSSTKFNGAFSPNTPGLYVNANQVLHIGYGAEIVSAGQDPNEAFAGYQPQQMAGMSAAPVAGAMPPAAGAPAAPVAAPAPQAYAAPAPAPAPVAAAPLPPAAHDFVAAVVAPPAPAPAPAPAPVVWPPAGWAVHPTAAGYYHNGVEAITEEQLRQRMSVPGLPAGR